MKAVRLLYKKALCLMLKVMKDKATVKVKWLTEVIKKYYQLNIRQTL